nr:hypothetical protein [Tanacetum cinerariifolium]
MRIPLLYRGEYSQWVERFMKYLEEQTDGEAMINSIKNDDQPLPRVTQVSIDGTTSTEKPHLKDKSMWSDQEKRIQKIDHLVRSLLIQGLSNDIYSLINSNKTTKDIWDALARHMLGFEYGEQDRKATVLDNCELNFKFLNNLQPEWKQYAIMMRQKKNLMDINIDALYNILKQIQGDVNDAMGSKKKTVVITSDPLALIAEKTNVSRSKEKVVVSSESEGNCKKVKVKDYEYYKTKMLLAKREKDKQVLFPEDQAWMESSSDLDQEINANMVFMAQIEKVLSYSEASSSATDEKISEEKYAKLEAERYEYMIRYSAYFDNEKQHRKQIAEQQVLYDKMSVQLVELDKHVRDLKNTVLEKDFKISELEEYCPDLSLDHRSCSKHMMGNHALLTNFVEKFLEMVRFGNNDFAVIAGYEDVVIGSMKIKKVYCVEGLGHNLFSVGQFCDKGLEFAFRKSTCFVRNEDGVDLLTGDRSSNLYTIALNKVASNSSTYLLAKASSSQSWLWHQLPTSMVEQAKLKLDLVGKLVDHTDYRIMIGSLMYVTSSRPDITFATYADHAGCHLDRKSTSGSVQFLGDNLVCWSSKKQNSVSISTAESEYVAVSGCCAQVLWMRTQLTDYGFFYDKVPIYCDLKSAIAISCNPVQHTRTKHIDV